MFSDSAFYVWPLEGKSMVYYHKYLLFTVDLDIGVKAMRNIAKYPLHHVTIAKKKKKKKKNVTNGRTDRRRSEFGTMIKQYCFVGININTQCKPELKKKT